MPTEITKELLRRIEIIAMVYENPDTYTTNDLTTYFKYSKQNLLLDLKNIREMDIQIHSIKKYVNILGKINLKTLNKLLGYYISINDNNIIPNLKPIHSVFKNRTLSVFINIIRAINNKKILQIEYGLDKYGQRIRREITPVGIHNTGKTFHIHAFENDDENNLKIFSIQKIFDIKFTNKISSHKEFPNLYNFYKNSWGSYTGGELVKVELEFKKETGEKIREKILVDNQEFIETENRFILKFEVKLSMEFVSWVMGWGGEVKVIKPETLKKEVLKKAKQLINRYEKK
ncbi:MAG TPA: WYL domain-containing protein [Ignavibacteria bacterium]|nr:WYL domain-containing protein [Ignavibacteria bacterium]